MTTTGTCKYATGQAVEINGPDFTTPGFPWVWRQGVVISVDPCSRGLHTIVIRTADGIRHAQTIGKRGGNRYVRPA